GYTFKTNNWGIDRLRVYASVSNLFTITSYSGFDPEMTVSANSAGEGDRAYGIDWGTYPVSRTYTFGVNLTF
ncbi:MAG: TonB-dependent receptor, partial [Muribaculaceae bacterium]|nr:TonB-dependent receptor [Muribaculaceae bacterium]